MSADCQHCRSCRVSGTSTHTHVHTHVHTNTPTWYQWLFCIPTAPLSAPIQPDLEEQATRAAMRAAFENPGGHDPASEESEPLTSVAYNKYTEKIKTL